MEQSPPCCPTCTTPLEPETGQCPACPADAKPQGFKRTWKPLESEVVYESELIQSAKSWVLVPAILNLVVGSLALIYHLYILIVAIQVTVDMQRTLHVGGIRCIASLAVVGGSILMLRLRNRAVAMLAMLIHMIPFPFPGVLAAIPLGLIGFATLWVPQVAQGFEATKRLSRSPKANL